MSVQNLNTIAARVHVAADGEILARSGVASVVRNGVGDYSVALSDAYADGQRVVAIQVTDLVTAGRLDDWQWTDESTVNVELENLAGDPTDLAFVLTVHRLPTTGNP